MICFLRFKGTAAFHSMHNLWLWTLKSRTIGQCGW